MAGREKVKSNNKPQISDSDNTGIKTKEIISNGNDANETVHPAWKLLSLEQVNLLLNLTVEEVQLQLEEILCFKHRQTCVKEAALVDYFVSGFWWAKEMNFTCQQISCFMALLQLLLDNIREKQMSLVDNFTEFAKTIAGTRLPMSPEDSSSLFDVDQAISITDYLKTSLFQHYTLYEFLFTQPREELQFAMEEHIEVIRPGEFVAPLEEGMPADVFFRYVPQAPAEQAEEVIEDHRELSEEERHGTVSQGTGPDEGCTADATQEVPDQLTNDVLENLQADIGEKLQVQEEAFSARNHRLKNTSSK